ncbi:hypothetical protein LTR56_021792 [Elasticomyces elasticus]|nr:hypothetical protein LTR56_021792 [Elasticomyces elasticus]KAK3630548.1 hypothetical protein LTR22_021464 [Elasticomyces elasticus]KAK5748468.1 hypothetical protein LTS12_021487 [Elasticomyces elasticus]
MASFELGDALWSASRGTSAANYATNPAHSALPRPAVATPLSQPSTFGFAAYQNPQPQTLFQQPAQDPSYGNQFDFDPNYQLQQGIPSQASSGQRDDHPNAGYADAQYSADRTDLDPRPWQAPDLPGVWNPLQIHPTQDSSMMPWTFDHAWPNPNHPHGNTPSLYPAASGAHQGTVMATGTQDDRPILQLSATNYSYNEEQGEAADGAGLDDFPIDFDFDFDFGQAGEWVQYGGAEQSGATGHSDQSKSSAEVPDVPASNYQSNQQAPYSHPYGGTEAEDDASEFSYDDEEDSAEENEPPANEDSVVEEDSGSDATEPAAPAYTHFASEAAAADYSEGRVATVYYKLPIANDDLHSVTDQQARGFCQSIFGALLLPPAAAPAGLDPENYNIQQAKALEKCKSLMQSADGYKLASSRCALLYYAAVRLHTQGIAKDLLKSTCTFTKTNLRLDRTSRFTTRMAKIIQTVSQNKLAAFDVLKDKSHDDFVRGPESYIRRKYTNAKGNANKRVVYTAGKEKLDGEDEKEEGQTDEVDRTQGSVPSTRGRKVRSSMPVPAAQPTQTVNDSDPTVRKTAQGKRKRSNDGEENNGERRRSDRNKRA